MKNVNDFNDALLLVCERNSLSNSDKRNLYKRENAFALPKHFNNGLKDMKMRFILFKYIKIYF